MLIITDEDVPAAVAQFLASRSHQVMLARDHFLPGTSDPVITQAASHQQAVVVTWNRRHFKALAKRRRPSGALRYPGMSVVSFRCPHTHGLPRIQKVIAEVEAVYLIRVVQGGVRMIAEITETVLRFEEG